MMSAPASSHPPFTVVLTGGIAAGKSMVASRFVELGADLIDADRIARELVAPGQPALAEIVRAFGEDMLTESGELDRRRMRLMVFADAARRRQLEAIVHPRVREETRRRAHASSAPYCLVAIPLFAEAREPYPCDRVLVVDAPREVQIDRLMRRDGMTHAQAEQALAAQASRERRLALADDVLDNRGEPGALMPAIERLDRLYRDLAKRA